MQALGYKDYSERQDLELKTTLFQLGVDAALVALVGAYWWSTVANIARVRPPRQAWMRAHILASAHARMHARTHARTR